MGRPPAYVFVVRHGNRLDAADKLWHLSSPTPYDPPLTYSGWTQSRTVGQRIGEILRGASTSDIRSSRPSTPTRFATAGNVAEPPKTPGDAPPAKKRRFKVVIHSSPFLRCIQTSIAIAAGLNSDPQPLQSPQSPGPYSPRRLAREENTPVGGDAFPELPELRVPKITKPVMRLDAFLGEWLSPSYFELITPPPSSYMMVASAKAELLRREDYTHFMQTPGHTHSHSTSQLWGSPMRAGTWAQRTGDEAASDARPVSPPSLLPLAEFPPQSQRLRSVSSVAGSTTSSSGAYVAPVPHFAISSKAPAPTSYVAHARDACVEFDYQWDSMRPPHDWGDGGEFGEEWTAMHRRFRRGLQHLIDWYTTSSSPTEPVTRSVSFKLAGPTPRHEDAAVAAKDDSEWAIDDDDSASEDDDDTVEESVVILVSHGAGCNALIGAITREPVLLDVGLSSLSVAVRRPGKEHPPTKSEQDAEQARYGTIPRRGTTSSLHHPDGVVPLDQYYDMKLYASTDHLRSSHSSPAVSRTNSIAKHFNSPRGRPSNSLSSALADVGYNDNNGVVGHKSPPMSSYYATGKRSAGTTKRPVISTSRIITGGGITVGSGVTSFLSSPLGRSSALSSGVSPGLWSPTSTRGDDDDDDSNFLLSFGPESTPASKGDKAVGNQVDGSAAAEIQATDAANAKSITDNNSLGILASPYISLSSSTSTTTISTTTIDTVNGGTVVEGAANENESAQSISLQPALQASLLSPLGTSSNAGLWAQQQPESESIHDLSLSKRRWTVNERA